MATKIFLVPADGLRVVDPVTRKPLPPEGGWVLDTVYWQRRVREGDARPGSPPKTSKAKAKE